MPLRLVLMGTGEFALPTFRGLYASRHEIVGLFTQPDRTGRGHHTHRHPVKQLGREHGTPIFQPADVNQPAAMDELRRLNADLCVVAAYGQLLSPQLLEIPRLGVINVHASLLPKYRGAAPVQHAILQGEAETGVTVFQIEPKLDAGPMLGSERLTIAPKETAGQLESRLAGLAVGLTLRVVDALQAGTAQHIPQDPRQVTRAPRLKKQDGAVDWTRSSQAISRHVRAMQPWPTAFTYLEQPDRKPQRLILLDVEPTWAASAAEPGRVVAADGKQLTVQTGEGILAIRRLRPDGKRDMDAVEYLCGRHIDPGARMTAVPTPS